MTRAANTIQQARAKERRRKAIVSAAAFLILVTCWLVGFVQSRQETELKNEIVAEVLPQAERFEYSNNGLITAYATVDGEEQVIGYAMTGSATGYGGLVTMLVATDPAGTVTAVTVLEHGETPNFFRQLERNEYYDQFIETNYGNSFNLGSEIDGVSGATLSAEAVASSIRQAVRGIAGSALVGVELPPDLRPVNFGAPEIALIGLFVVSFFLHRLRHQPAIKKYGRLAVLLTGLIVLGFIFNKPFTLSNVVTLLSGVWPDWHTNLYWFILVGGIILITSIQGKNPYCSWFCPFGAAQELLGSISGAKPYQPRKLYNRLRWVQRSLSFTAIALGLALRQPGAISYEPFGALFGLQGSWSQWVLLFLILFGSLVIYRPFCNYICPLDPVVDYIGEIRRMVRNLWQKRLKPAISTSRTAS